MEVLSELQFRIPQHWVQSYALEYGDLLLKGASCARGGLRSTHAWRDSRCIGRAQSISLLTVLGPLHEYSAGILGYGSGWTSKTSCIW
jgi:hypothetical protein